MDDAGLEGALLADHQWVGGRVSVDLARATVGTETEYHIWVQGHQQILIAVQ
jgi:hypothetical protein